MTALTGTHWRIIEIGGETIPHDDGGRPARLRLDGDDGRFAASAGCNNMTGGYALEGDALRFGAAAMTMMMCPDPLMQRERALVVALTATLGYAIDGDTLSLLDGDGRVLVRAEVGEADQ